MATSTTDAHEVGAPRARGAVGPLAPAGVASLGAGAVHAAAAGAHAGDAVVALVFAALALAQLGWGATAVVASGRWPAAVGVGIGATAFGGWLLARTAGIGVVDGFAEVEAIGWADAVAAALALVATVAAARVLLGGATRPPGPLALTTVATVVAVAALAGLTTVEDRGHDAGGGDGAGGGHDHGEASGPVQPGHDHGSPAVPPTPYDPERAVDLSGVPGVTPEQQARAEELVASTLERLPRFADHRDAEALGYRSIGDGSTGHEHLVNWEEVDDGRVLDPDHPESLVYEVGPGGDRTLVSAMFMLPAGTALDDVPDVGGPLTRWHVRDDLCRSDDPTSPRVAGLSSIGGSCPAGTVELDPVPVLHVWIVPHPCGPFSALEGVAAGPVAPGEEHACPRVHGP